MKKILVATIIMSTIIITGCSSGGDKNICSYNTYDCPDFPTHAKAQKLYESCGGVNNDVHELDRDKDGSACETLP